MQKIITHLWFNDQAEEAAQFYVSLFKNSRVLDTVYYPESAEAVSGRPAGSVMTVNFELDGQEYIALNGGPMFKFNEAISLLVICDDQAEVDRLWEALTKEGEEARCGWLKDRYGLSWQIVPDGMSKMLQSGDSEAANRAMAAMLNMKKIDLATIERAYEGDEHWAA